MANAFNAYLQAKQGAMREGQNALAMEEIVKKNLRDQQLRDILAGAYKPATPAIPQPGGALEGPTPSGAALSPVAAGPDIPAQAGGMDMKSALDAMYAGGFGPEAMGYESKLRASGGLPSSVKEWQYYSQLPEADQKRFLQVKRGHNIEMIGGVPHIVTPSGASTPLSTLKAETAAAGEKERGRKLGMDAATASGKAVEQVGKIRANITNLREVIRLVGEGAETGPLAAKLPSIRASSIELDNMQKQLGLDVIGAVTFGALSKGELDLALSKALPTHLQGPDLVSWTNRKIAAQEKLSDYYEKQGIYLSKPGSSQAGWLEQQKSAGTKGVPKIGTIKNGYIFMGGNPADQKSWKKQ